MEAGHECHHAVRLAERRQPGFSFRDHKLLIDGQWVDAWSEKTAAIFDPSNGQQIAHIAQGGVEDVTDAVAAARHAFAYGPWAKMSPKARHRLIWTLGERLDAISMN